MRELIDRGLEEQPLGRSIGDLSGRLALALPAAGWRKRLRDRNWR